MLKHTAATPSATTLSITGADYDAQDRVVSYGVSPASEPCNGGAVPVTYDRAGRVHKQGATTYTYDLLGNLLKVETLDAADLCASVTITYDVDPQNRRVGRSVDGVFDAGWLYIGGHRVVAELDSAGKVVKSFTYGVSGHSPSAMMYRDPATGSVRRFAFVQDHVGSIVRVLELTSNDVVEVERSEYSAFGVLVGRTTASSFSDIGGQPFGFAGGLFDPITGLTRFGARDYDPRLGRWLARDSLGFGAGDTNLYAYVGGDPVNLVDPAGQNPLAVAAAKAAAAGAVGGALWNAGLSMAAHLYVRGEVDFGHAGREALTGAVQGAIAGAAIGGLGHVARGLLGRFRGGSGSGSSGVRGGNGSSGGGSCAPKARPKYGNPDKIQKQMKKRGWTEDQIVEAMDTKGIPAAGKNGPATRYVHPETGRSVVVDDATGEVFHVGGDGFKYD